MINHLWAAGAHNNGYNSADWSNGAIKAGDTASIGSGDVYLPGGSLYGATIDLSGQSAGTAILELASATANVVVAQDTYTYPGGFVQAAYGTVDVTGTSMLALAVHGGNNTNEAAILNVGDYSQAIGGITEAGKNASVTVNTQSTSTWSDTGSSIGFGDVAQINGAVVGTGTFALAFQASATFSGYVGSGQTVSDQGGALTLADAKDFHGKVAWTPQYATDIINLPGLLATSAVYSGGVEHFMSGSTNLFNLTLATPTAPGFTHSATGCSLVG